MFFNCNLLFVRVLIQYGRYGPILVADQRQLKIKRMSSSVAFIYLRTTNCWIPHESCHEILMNKLGTRCNISYYL